MEERVYETDKNEGGKLDEILKENPYDEQSFARVETNIKQIEDKIYLYINAKQEFFKFAEEKFKKLESIKRCGKEKEEEIIELIKKEKEAEEAGFGKLF